MGGGGGGEVWMVVYHAGRQAGLEVSTHRFSALVVLIHAVCHWRLTGRKYGVRLVLTLSSLRRGAGRDQVRPGGVGGGGDHTKHRIVTTSMILHGGGQQWKPFWYFFQCEGWSHKTASTNYKSQNTWTYHPSLFREKRAEAGDQTDGRK